MITSTHLYRISQVSSLGPSGQPSHWATARGDCTTWLADSRSLSLVAGCGAGQAKPGCFPGEWPFLGSDPAHGLWRLGNVPFLLPHPTASLLQNCCLGCGMICAKKQIFLKEKTSRLPHNPSSKGEEGQGRGNSVRLFSAGAPHQAWCAVAMDTQAARTTHCGARWTEGALFCPEQESGGGWCRRVHI